MENPHPALPKSYLLLNNIGKRQNWGQLLRSAQAFGVTEVAVAGAKKLQDLALFGNQGTANHASFRFFDTLEAACGHYKALGARICGIEIRDDALEIGRDNVFTGDTVFMLGNEGTGMSNKQQAQCDFFTYIPQYSEATASLNVATAGAIVLHHFALWAKFPPAEREGEKFKVAVSKSKLEKFLNPSAEEAELIEQKRQERKRNREEGTKEKE